MRLLENDKFLNLQPGKKMLLEMPTVMSGPAEWRGSGALTVIECLKPLSFRGLRPLNPTPNSDLPVSQLGIKIMLI